MKYSKEEKEIINAINQFDYSQIFMLSDFEHQFQRDVIQNLLNKLVVENKIVKLTGDFGEFYFRSCYIPIIKDYSTVGFDDIAKAIARKNGWKIFPSDYTSFNKMGLSTQNVMKPIFSSTGPNCVFHYNNVEIKFNQLDFDVEGLSVITVMFIQAIKILGQNNIIERDIKTIKDRLPKECKQILLEEGKKLDFWIYKIIKQICNDDE